MTKTQLSQLDDLRREIVMWEQEIQELEIKKNNCVTASTVEASSRSRPYQKRLIWIGGDAALTRRGHQQYLRYQERIRNLQILVAANKERCERELSLIMHYIARIDDSIIRQIVLLKYAKQMTWENVAAAIGGNNKAESLRKKLERYLEKN